MRKLFVAALLSCVAFLGSCGIQQKKPSGPPGAGELLVTQLRIGRSESTLGIEASHVAFSWQIQANARDVRQSAYQIRVAAGEEEVGNASDLWFDSGKVTSDRSIQIPYAGRTLQSRGRYVWQVRVWDQRGRVSQWSAPMSWEMGLLKPSDWSAKWIEPATSSRDQAVMLRKEFQIRGGIVRARAYVTSRGLYQLFLNGRRVGDAELTPGWTSYHERIQYQTYDVTELLKAGDNAVGALLGTGWYSGVMGFTGGRNFYGKNVAMLVQLEITHDDGSVSTIVSDGAWKSAGGPIVMSGFYAGETYDARLEQAGWNEAGFDDKQWSATPEGSYSYETLIAPEAPPVRKMQELKPRAITRTANGRVLVDMGQNMVGWVRLSVSGPAGSTITLRHAEILDANGAFYTKNLRAARQTVRYTLKGNGVEVYEPHFTFQGFRYVEVDGFSGELTAENITGVVLYSAMDSTGEFRTSNPLLNQLQRNIVWGQRGNFVDVPTDCPQRDERLGWTGDAQVFAATAAFNADVSGFFAKWLKDLAADQFEDGSVPFVVPDMIQQMYAPDGRGKIAAGGAAGWGDAATIIPWAMYLSYGDQRILQEQYASMTGWVEYQRQRAGADLIWDGDFQFGDWLDFGADQRNSFGATDTSLIATAYLAHSAELVSQAARVLGKNEDAARYEQLSDEVKAAFQKTFISADGTVGAGTQTAYVLALQFELLPEASRAIAARRLAETVRAQGHLTTGFLGTPGLLFALSEHGYLEDAYRLLNREEYPSWLYPVKQGATTIWERWDGVKPDGSLQTPSMNSFNHYAYGAVGEWMYRVVAGINMDPKAPGYKHVLIKPQPGGGLTSANASHATPYGALTSSWSIENGKLNLVVEIPANASATVTLPGEAVSGVMEKGVPIRVGSGIRAVRSQSGRLSIEIGSGRYEFTQPWHESVRSNPTSP